MKLTEHQEKALDWALTNRSALHHLCREIETLWTAKDTGDHDDIRRAEVRLLVAYDLAASVLKKSL